MSQAKSGIFIKFLPENLDVPASHNDHSVLDVALRAGIEMDYTCGGHGTCGTCVVEVIEGSTQLEPREDLEQEMATDRGFREEERLSCQIKPVSGLVVKRCTK